MVLKISNFQTRGLLMYILFFSFFAFLKKFYLFLTALGLCCWVQTFSSCGQWGQLFFVVGGLLIEVAPLAVEHRL